MEQKNVAELKKELEELEELQKQDRINQQLDRMRKNIPPGTCYATHQLSRYMGGKKSYHFRVIRIKEPEYKERGYRDYWYNTDNVHVFKDGERFEVHKGKGEEDSPGLFKYEITPEEFNDVWNGLVPGIQKLVDEMRMRHKAVDYVSQGKHDEESGSQNLLEWVGFDYIDFEEKNASHYVHKPNTTVFEVLRWEHHPYLFNKRLYKAPKWREMIHRIADEMEKSARNWGSVIWERDYPRVVALRKFLKEN